MNPGSACAPTLVQVDGKLPTVSESNVSKKVTCALLEVTLMPQRQAMPAISAMILILPCCFMCLLLSYLIGCCVSALSRLNKPTRNTLPREVSSIAVFLPKFAQRQVTPPTFWLTRREMLRSLLAVKRKE